MDLLPLRESTATADCADCGFSEHAHRDGRCPGGDDGDRYRSPYPSVWFTAFLAVAVIVWSYSLGQALVLAAGPLRLLAGAGVVALVLWVGLTSQWVRR